MKRNIVIAVIVIVVAVIAFVIGRSTAIAPEQEGKIEGERGAMLKSAEPSFIGAEKHEISVDEAKKLIKNRQDGKVVKAAKGKVPAVKGAAFERAALEQILAQPGCDKVRFYYAAEDNGSPTIVLVGVDTSGKDMTQGKLMERGSPCPPYCDAASSLLQ
jgi:hypothetical protein